MMSYTYVNRVTRLCFAILAVMFATTAISTSAQGSQPPKLPSFSMHAVGSASATARYLPYGVNDSGMVAGTDVSGSIAQGFWFIKGKVHAANPPSGEIGASILALNSADKVAAQACPNAACAASAAFTGQIRGSRVHWTRLPLPKGPGLCGHNGCSSSADAISSNGDLAGQVGLQAVRWIRASNGHFAASRLAYTDPTRFTSSTGLAVDSFGDVAGTESNGLSSIGVFWPRHGSPMVLNDFCSSGLVRGGATFSEPYGITTAGSNSKRSVTVAGRCFLISPPPQPNGYGPALWTIQVNGPSSLIVSTARLDANPGSESGQAGAINQRKWIAGNQGDAASTATLWIQRHPHLLSDLITPSSSWVIGSVHALSEKGRMAFVASRGGMSRTFLLSPR
jgi:hypothetical protein